jgi:hypothetical protein
MTTNNSAGVSVFSSDLPSVPPSIVTPDGIRITFCYGIGHFPAKLTEDQDLQSYQHLIENPPGMVVPNGIVWRIAEFPPGYTSTMHRTISVNFNIVMEGELELILDSGEKRILKRGDMAIQRAVNHAWRNVSITEWARMFAVPIPAEPFQVGDTKMKGDAIPGIRA